MLRRPRSDDVDLQRALAPHSDERWPFYDDDEIAAVTAVLRSGRRQSMDGSRRFRVRAGLRATLRRRPRDRACQRLGRARAGPAGLRYRSRRRSHRFAAVVRCVSLVREAGRSDSRLCGRRRRQRKHHRRNRSLASSATARAQSFPSTSPAGPQTSPASWTLVRGQGREGHRRLRAGARRRDRRCKRRQLRRRSRIFLLPGQDHLDGRRRRPSDDQGRSGVGMGLVIQGPWQGFREIRRRPRASRECSAGCTTGSGPTGA